MAKYKVQVSKNHKKYSLVIHSPSLLEARDRVHNEGYSVLNIEEYKEQVQNKDRYYFTVNNKGKIKSGSIFGDDIFKIYLRLRKDLGYEVLELYKEKNQTDDKKQDLLKNLEEAYLIYEGNNKKSTKNKKNTERKEVKEETIDDFYMKKELETTYKLLDFVIEKTEAVLHSENLGKLDPEKRAKIEQVYQNIIQLKNSTNTSKLKEIGELALLRIGQLELEIVEKEKNVYAKEYLKETNKLLKKIGSDKHFVEKHKDIKLQIGLQTEKLRKWFKAAKVHRNNAKKHTLDKNSYDYLKTATLLNRYKERNKQVQLYIIKHFWEYFIPSKKEEFSKLLLTRAVLRQNIMIMKAKKSGNIYSYTKLIKGYDNFFKFVQKIIVSFNTYLFAVIAIFSFSFLSIIITNYFFNGNVGSMSFNYYGLYGIIVVIVSSWLLKAIRGFWTLGISTFIFAAIMFFGGINF